MRVSGTKLVQGMSIETNNSGWEISQLVTRRQTKTNPNQEEIIKNISLIVCNPLPKCGTNFHIKSQ
jgi:hypothetical protein